MVPNKKINNFSGFAKDIDNLKDITSKVSAP